MKDKHYTDWNELPLTLTVMQGADILGIGRHAAYHLVQSGQLPSIKIGKQIRIYRGTLENYLEQN